MFGFQTFEETELRIKLFFTNAEIAHPDVSHDSRKIAIKYSYLTDCEQILVAKTLFQPFPRRAKAVLIVGASRQCAARALEK